MAGSKLKPINTGNTVPVAVLSPPGSKVIVPPLCPPIKAPKFMFCQVVTCIGRGGNSWAVAVWIINQEIEKYNRYR